MSPWYPFPTLVSYVEIFKTMNTHPKLVLLYDSSSAGLDGYRLEPFDSRFDVIAIVLIGHSNCTVTRVHNAPQRTEHVHSEHQC